VGPVKIESLNQLCSSETLRFHQKYLNLCSEDKWRSYVFGTTWGWVINDRNVIFGWTNPLSGCSLRNALLRLKKKMSRGQWNREKSKAIRRELNFFFNLSATCGWNAAKDARHECNSQTRLPNIKSITCKELLLYVWYFMFAWWWLAERCCYFLF